MKIIINFLLLLFILSCTTTSGKEKTYIASTPAGVVVKKFLGISLSDSVDFVRWELFIRDNRYHIHCNYGISQPNTNGFIGGGVKMELSGEWKKTGNYYELQNGNEKLVIAELNDDLLHLADTNKNLLVGNGGWSYTLNSLAPSGTDQLSLSPEQTVLSDSMKFEGRSPCKVPGIISEGRECYKIKWLITLYADKKKNEPGQYKILATRWRQEGGKTGNWSIITTKDGHTIYQLNDEKGKGLIHLLKADNNVLLFTDANGKVLTGDGDFSYTLNRRVL